MPQGPFGIDRPFSSSSVSMNVPDIATGMFPDGEGIEGKILRDVGVETNVIRRDEQESGIANFSEETDLIIEFIDRVSIGDIIGIATILPKDNTEVVSESTISVTDPEGAVGGPRPLLSSDIVLSYEANIAGSEVEAMPSSQRASILERDIRESSPVLVDVSFGVANTMVIIRQDVIGVSTLEQVTEAIDDASRKRGVELASRIFIEANGV